MTAKLKKTYNDLVREAKARIENIPPVLAMDEVDDGNIIVIDVRDIRELQRDGCIPGSYHVPRGLIESWIDPESDYFKPVFAEDKKFLIVCASGRRSALVVDTLQHMGFGPVANMDGGFAVWKLLDGPVSDFNEAKHIDLFDPTDQLVEL